MLIHLAWITPLLLLVFFLGSPRFRGDIAERRVGRILAAGLERNRYTIFEDVVLPFGGGTRRIGHVVISKSGIFVIDSEHAPGRVSGTEVQERWRRKRFGRSHRFENPVHRNRVHAEALAAALALPLPVFRRAVVLVGAQAFGKTRPQHVVEPERLVAWIRRDGPQRLDDGQVAQALQGIQAARLQFPRGRFSNPVAWLRWLLFAALLAGLYLAFGDTARRALDALDGAGVGDGGPAAGPTDGRAGSAQQRWEDSLICAWSEDTGRCACYDPQGQRVTLAVEKCRELAERGSILKR